MQFCSNCGSSDMIYLGDGGCGGIGQMVGCGNCKSVFQQRSGGILPTKGGERWQRMPFNLDEYQKLKNE